MSEQSIIPVLNELLTLEQAAPAPRLFESTVFVSQWSVEDWHIAKSIAKASREHCASLADLIQDLGGTPGLRAQDVMTADWHFQELHSAIPRLIDEYESLISKYKIAAEHVASHAAATSLINQILQHHQQKFSELQSLLENTAETSS